MTSDESEQEGLDSDEYVNERLDEAAVALEDAICASEDRDQREALIDHYRGVVWVLGRDYGGSDDEECVDIILEQLDGVIRYDR